MKEYTEKWYNQHQKWRKTYDKLSKWIMRHLDFDSVLDLGCGNAYLLTHMLSAGKAVKGIDITKVVENIVPVEVRPFIVIDDITKPLDVPVFDLVISTEVAEHLFDRFADTFVQNICNHSNKWICLTASTKSNKKSRNHVNPQPYSYWINKVAQHGFSLREDLTNECRRIKAKHAIWLMHNMMVFQKNGVSS